MMKKALALAGAGAMLLSVALPVLAHGGCFGGYCYGGRDGGDLDISNSAMVMNDVYTKADTGDNSIGGKMVWGGTIRTGAAGATSVVGNDVNGTYIDDCDCVDGDVDLHNHAMVWNNVYTKADTGDNSIGGRCVGGGTIVTGAAGATSAVTNFVNTLMMGITP